MTTPSPPRPPWPRRLKERVARCRRGLFWIGGIVSGLGAAVALWPLAITVWNLLGFTAGQTWRLAALGTCSLVLAASVVGVNWKRPTPVRLVWLILAAWTVAAGTVAVMTTLAWLMLDTPQWKPPEQLTPKNLDAIATRAFAIVAGLGGVALLVIAYRRQRTTEADAVRAEAANVRAELAAEREIAKLFTDTFDSASSKLGDEHAAVRLAGVHALARLADEAPEGRNDLVQMVIDVLCAYLRMPYTPAPDPLPKNASKAQREEHRQHELEFASFREVRHTIVRIIGNRLREPTRWQGKNYDFTGVVFDGGDLGEAVFSKCTMDFTGAKFSEGTVSFNRAKFTDAVVNFSKAHFAGGTVVFRAASFTGGKILFLGAHFDSGVVSFGGADFTGGRVSFESSCFTGGRVDFQMAMLTGKTVSFIGAQFADGVVDFCRARFAGKAVLFTSAKFTGGRVDFTGASGTYPRGLPKGNRPGQSGEIVLSEQWQSNANESQHQEGPCTSADAPNH